MRWLVVEPKNSMGVDFILSVLASIVIIAVLLTYKF